LNQKRAAFMSYVHSDNKNNRLTEFRERLSNEVCMQIGEDFPIFQDQADILLGHNWKKRIEESLDAVMFLIPIITPSFFKSEQCRAELERFLEREKELKRADLILPVYYVECPLLNDPEKRATDKLAQVIAERQYADWRELRFEPFTTPQFCKNLAQIANQIFRTLEGKPTLECDVRKSSSDKKDGEVKSSKIVNHPVEEIILKSTQEVAAGGNSAAARGPYSKTEPPMLIVDPLNRGNHATISAALKAANPGDRILIRPGFYQEGLIIDKPLEIIGDGAPGDVVVEATGMDVLLFKTTMGRVVNLTLRQMGGGKWYGVDIAQGRLEMEDCDIISKSLSCVAIHDGADPRLRRNRIHDSKSGGVSIYDNGQGILEDNDIFGNDCSGVVITEGGNPKLYRNRIHGSIESGVYICDNGQGILEDNDIFGNGLSGVAIKAGGSPKLFRNCIHECKQSGVHVFDNGQGVFEDNDIFGNNNCGVHIENNGNPVLLRNRISKNGNEAIRIQKKGAGTIEDNDLRDNIKGAWNISNDSISKVKRARNLE
jgi:parallel beta-helix repeat protein